TVAWLDTLSAAGRGVLMRGRWAEPHEPPSPTPTPPRRISMPFRAPGFTLSMPAIRAFNSLFFHRHRSQQRLRSPQAFFHPLDAIRHWNRLYGRLGFVQHQCVIPLAAGADPLRRLLAILREHHAASFLSVLKDCGAEGRGLLSFPMRGLSLALDLPMRGKFTQTLVDALNEVVIEAGGRIYLAKDALTRPEDLRAMEGPRLEAWQVLRGKWDPQRRLRSALSQRLLGDHP
ncbi:MAG: FAD-binding oxidoreductase, partial [Myxococcota bacterium]